MLTITIPGTEMWDEENECFATAPGEDITVTLEHSLVSLSKWESKHHKAFLGKQRKTKEETLDYIRCMVVGGSVSDDDLSRLSPDNVTQINAYIEDPMTATYISDVHKGGGRETVTAELVYYWMIALNIPFECQYWHLNRLLTLINVCSIKNQPTKKMGRNELMRRNTALNAARRKQLHTKG